jgi:pimeloyl-ACP methyl ester carboxylesterase
MKILFTVIVLVLLLCFAFSCQQDQERTGLAESPSENETGYAEVNGTKLHYEMAGTGVPLVLIHGWSFDSRCWESQFNTFAEKHRVLRYDLRGFGRSDLPDVGEKYSHTADLIALLDHLNIEKANILGHSYGGRIAFDFVFNYPERTISLILPDAAMDVTNLAATPNKDVLAWINDTWRVGREEGIEEAKKIWVNGSPLKPAMSDPRSAPLVRRMIEDYSGWHWVNDDPHIGFVGYPLERLQEIKVPALIIVGELNPSIYHEWADAQNENIPNSKKVIIPDAGHALNIENPEKFNEFVLRFLSEI